MFRFEPFQHAVQKAEGVRPVEEPLGRYQIGRLAEISSLCVAGVDRQQYVSAPALQHLIRLPAMAEKEVAVGLEERPKLSLARIGRCQRSLLEQVDDREVLFSRAGSDDIAGDTRLGALNAFRTAAENRKPRLVNGFEMANHAN